MTVLTEQVIPDPADPFAPFDPAVDYIAEEGNDASTVVEAGLALGAAFLLYRALTGASIDIRPGDVNPTTLRAAAVLAYRKVTPLWIRAAVPALTRAYQLGSAELTHEEAHALAGDYAASLGDYINQTSADALVEGYQSLVNRRWSPELAYMRARDAYGVDSQQMQSYVASLEATKNTVLLTNREQLTGDASKALADRLLATRAHVIGANESWTVSQLAQQIVWLTAQAEGTLSDTATKRWLTAADERVCPVCAPLDGVEIKVSSKFKVGERGALWGPAAHVNCRCMMVLADSGEPAEELGELKKAFDPHQKRDEAGRWTKITENDKEIFTSHWCDTLAKTLHDRTGWPLWVVADEEDGEPGWVHAGVMTPDNQWVDVHGFQDPQKVVDHWCDFWGEISDVWLEKAPPDLQGLEPTPEITQRAHEIADDLLKGHVSKAEFDPTEHPRGQPQNKGQFRRVNRTAPVAERTEQQDLVDEAVRRATEIVAAPEQAQPVNPFAGPANPFAGRVNPFASTEVANPFTAAANPFTEAAANPFAPKNPFEPANPFEAIQRVQDALLILQRMPVVIPQGPPPEEPPGPREDIFMFFPYDTEHLATGSRVNMSKIKPGFNFSTNQIRTETDIIELQRARWLNLFDQVRKRRWDAWLNDYFTDNYIEFTDEASFDEMVALADRSEVSLGTTTKIGIADQIYEYYKDGDEVVVATVDSWMRNKNQKAWETSQKDFAETEMENVNLEDIGNMPSSFFSEGTSILLPHFVPAVFVVEDAQGAEYIGPDADEYPTFKVAGGYEISEIRDFPMDDVFAPVIRFIYLQPETNAGDDRPPFPKNLPHDDFEEPYKRPPKPTFDE